MVEIQNHNNFTPHTEANKKVVTVIYVLYALSFIFIITIIPALMMNYLKRCEVKGTFLETHIQWQLRSFWFSVLWGIIGALTLLFGVGFIILLINYFWFMYRIVKGWLALNNNAPMY